MGAMNEIIEAPLTRDELADRYRGRIDDPRNEIEFHDCSGKIGGSRYAVDFIDLFVAPPSHPS